jgi:hypothetical protein
VYLFSYLILFMLTLKEVTVKRFTKRQTSILLLLFLLVFSLSAAIRYGVGKDYFNYLSIFQNINNFNDFDYLEPGFRALVVILKNLGFTDNSLFFFFAFLSILLLILGIKKTSEYPILSLFIFFLVFYIGYIFNGMRQGVVMGLFVFLLKDIEERKFLKVLFFTILGMSIHSSASFILVGYFFVRLVLSRKNYIILTIILLGLVITNGLWTGFVIKIMPGFIESRIFSYMQNFDAEVDNIGLLQRVVILVPFLLYYPKLSSTNKSFEFLFKLYYLGFIFYSIFSFQDMFATRINMLFRVLEVILFPYLLTININKYEKALIFVVTIVWGGVILLTELNHPWNYPFVTIFSLY